MAAKQDLDVTDALFVCTATDLEGGFKPPVIVLFPDWDRVRKQRRS